MTRARVLKDVIRARASKTGERYTTARRHVLNSLRARSEPIASAPVSLVKKWGDTTVQLYFYPKPGDKTSVVVTNSKLTGGPMVEERRGLWRAALDRLARHFKRP